ncbi:HEAT repeat domain-containing protein [Azospirillum thermophilum]|uniref:HEAT repeat domain-containing protein n=1 Tax=Azospirillum thermophilum TaxID=2202148 RepID=A0A2S2CXT9_9PROT|nr:HEAT repeat domain-containing protein [Azospirillum thermophilum]AWK89235.1 HEAT repeat domain-containing protein [Azospirillum thermophilum]
MALVKPKKDASARQDTGAGVDPVAGLADADPAVRRRAALALAGRADGAGALAGRLPQEDDPSVREVVLTALARLGTAEAAAALVPLLDSEDAGLRNAVAESLQQMPGEVAAPAVRPLLDSSDPDLRIFAALLVGRLPVAERFDWLTGVLQRDPDINVCLAVVEALLETGHPEVLPALEGLEARFPGDPFVTFSVASARRRFVDR